LSHDELATQEEHSKRKAGWVHGASFRLASAGRTAARGPSIIGNYSAQEKRLPALRLFMHRAGE
jgi:hypothetical protein